MVKTIEQIEMEMNTIKLIKETLDVSGFMAKKFYEQWTKTNDGKPLESTNKSLEKLTVDNASSISIEFTGDIINSNGQTGNSLGENLLKSNNDKLKNSDINVEVHFDYDKGVNEIINAIHKSFKIKI